MSSPTAECAVGFLAQEITRLKQRLGEDVYTCLQHVQPDRLPSVTARHMDLIRMYTDVMKDLESKYFQRT